MMYLSPPASAGNVGHLLGRGKPGVKDQLVELPVAQLVPVLDEPQGQSLFEDLLPVEPPAVILDFDDDIASPVVGPEEDGSLPALLRLFSFLRRLQAVIDRVPDHVHQGFIDLIHHAAVDFRLFS